MDLVANYRVRRTRWGYLCLISKWNWPW